MAGITPKFFGQYLLEKDVLDKDQLIESINYQKSRILKLGEIAIKKNFMSEKDVAKIHNEQKRTDKRFGDLAVEMEMLTQQQLEEILTYQKNNHIYLGEAIVECGYMDQAQLDQHLKDFQEEQKTIPPIEVMIEEDIPHKDLVEVAVDISEKIMLRVGDMVSKTGRLRTEESEIKNLGVTSVMKLSGDVPSKYVLNLSWDVAHQIAKKTFKKDDLPYDEELIGDTTSEFVNIICGNVRAKMLEMGKKVDITPPTWHPDKQEAAIKLEDSEQATIVAGYTPLGNYEIALISKG